MYFCESQMDQNPRTGYNYSPSGRKCLMLLGSRLWNSSRDGVFPTRSSHPRGKGGGWPKWSPYFLPNSAVRKVTPPVWGRVERPPGGLYLKSGRSGFPNGSYLWHVQLSWSLWLLRTLSLLCIALFHQLGGLWCFPAGLHLLILTYHPSISICHPCGFSHFLYLTTSYFLLAWPVVSTWRLLSFSSWTLFRPDLYCQLLCQVPAQGTICFLCSSWFGMQSWRKSQPKAN